MKLVRRVAALVAGVVLSTSGTTAVAAGESVTLTGTYQRMAKDVDDGQSRGHVYDDLLVTPSKTYRLRLRGAPPKPGSTVRISANTTDGGSLDVTRTTTMSTSQNRSTLGSTTTLAILAYWTSPDSVTQASAKAQLFSDDNTWLKEVSYGQSSLTGAVTPWVKISPPTNGRCYEFADQIMARAKAGAGNLGYSPYSYHRTLVYFPRCVGGDTTNITGWAFEPGDSIWLNGVMDRATSMHEHGHSFGVGHARSLACTANGVRVTLSSSCTAGEYGDPYDVMGNSAYAGHYNGLHKDRLGLLGGTRKHLMTSTTGTFTIAPFERPSTLPLVVVANGATYGRRYWVEYRQPIGMDARFPAGATGGAMIHYEDPARGDGSFLLDPTPADASFGTAALGPGRSWRSPDGVTIAVNSVSTSGMTVTISGARPEPVPPSPPRSPVAQAGHGRALLSWQPPSSDGQSTIRRYVVSVSNGSLYTVEPSQTSYLVTGLTNDTTYTMTVRAENDAGDSKPSTAVSATPRASTVPPAVTVRTPVPGATVSGTVRLEADVKADALLTASHLKEWYVDGRRIRSGDTFDWPTLDYANGPHVVRVVGRDELDRLGSVEATYHVLNYRPSVEFTAPAADARVTGGVVTLAATAAGSGDGAALDRVEFVSYTGAVIGTARTAPYEVPWDLTNVLDGTYMISARAFDTKGRSTTATLHVNVYHPLPTVTITSPAASATLRGTSVTVVADAQPGTAGRWIAHVTFSSSLGYVVDSVAPYEATFDTSAATGSHWIDVRAVESPGGRAVASSRYLHISNPLPLLSVTSPTSSYLRGQTITLAGTAKPSSSGGAAVQKVVLTSSSGTSETPVAADGTWSLPWDVKGRYGTQSVTITAVDTTGYRAKMTRNYHLERPLPVVALVTPADGASVTTEPTEFVARVEPAADAVHGIGSVCFVTDGYFTLGCGVLGADGLYRATVTMPAGNIRVRVRVYETDGHVTYQADRWVGVYGPPAVPYHVTADTGPDATVTLRWFAYPSSDYAPVDEYVVRDEHGAVVARGRGAPLTFRPPRLGTDELYSVEAVNKWGTTTRAIAAYPVRAKWHTYVDNVTLSRNATTYPGTVTVTARLTRFDGTPMTGRSMHVLAWSTWGSYDVVKDTAPTSFGGYASATFVPGGTSAVELTWYGDAAHEGSTAQPVYVTVRALVTGNLTRGRIPLGSTTAFAGRVQPARPGGFVYLQRFYAGAWRTVTYRTQDAYGRVSIPIKPPVRGAYTYRLYYGGDAHRLGNTSPPRTLYVY